MFVPIRARSDAQLVVVHDSLGRTGELALGPIPFIDAYLHVVAVLWVKVRILAPFPEEAGDRFPIFPNVEHAVFPGRPFHMHNPIGPTSCLICSDGRVAVKGALPVLADLPLPFTRYDG